MENDRENRLRQQIEELVRSRVSVLEQDVSSLQREFNEAFTRLLERTDAAANLSESDPVVGQIAAEITAQVDQASTSSVKLGADLALLRDSVVELDQQRNQAEVLNTLIARAANFAPRVVLFVVKGGNALAWAARGFDDSVGNSSIRGLSVALQSDTALRSAVTASQTCYGAPDQQSENQLIFNRLGNLQPQRVLVVPLKVRGKSAAVFYADSGDRGESAVNVEAIELLVSTAGLVVELVSLRSRLGEVVQPVAAKPQAETQPAVAKVTTAELKEETAPVVTPEPVVTPAPVVTPEPVVTSEPVVTPEPAVSYNTQPEVTPVVEPQPEPEAVATPEVKVEETAPPENSWAMPSEPEPQPAVSFEPVAQVEEQPQSVVQSADESFFIPSEPQPVAPPASAFEEAVSVETAGVQSQGFEFVTTPPVQESVSLQEPPPVPMFTTPPPAAAQPSEEEAKMHNDARRFARLLVSEIKLYNEQKVSEGRSHKDLYDRLKDDIDRSRQMYEKRVAPNVATKFDYFYDEMVNTLAEGDPSKLGSDYPGPSVAL